MGRQTTLGEPSHLGPGERLRRRARLHRQLYGPCATFAEAYADQNERDHQAALADAVRTGRLPAEELPTA
ncbi:hypothetical protein OG736_01300 [Streptomyces sp. NBC_01334]|nr:hypothetical protein OG736_01300 [Streptomyces sp. NBC_01334]